MDGNGGEKRKADEMVSDSVEVPLAELREVAEKAGEEAETASKIAPIPWSLRLPCATATRVAPPATS